jgi:thioredoxin reductase (NADPH)
VRRGLAITIHDSIIGETNCSSLCSVYLYRRAAAYRLVSWYCQERCKWVYPDRPDLMIDNGQNNNNNNLPKGWNLDRQPFLLETNIPGIFAAGDVRSGSVKRVASGVGEGSIAIQFVHQYLKRV